MSDEIIDVQVDWTPEQYEYWLTRSTQYWLDNTLFWLRLWVGSFFTDSPSKAYHSADLAIRMLALEAVNQS
jgi:hypothetical protein